MQALRANTAVDVLIGPFVDDTDGKTPETALTISQADVLLSKLGQSLTQKNDANAATHDAVGYYNCPLNTTDTATEGQLDIVVNESGALPVFKSFMVMAEAAWDSLYVAKDTGFMDVNVSSLDANVITATAINADAITAAKIADDAISSEHLNTGAITADAFAANAIIAATLATDSITADALAADAVTEIQSGLAPASEYDVILASTSDEVSVIHDTVLSMGLSGSAVGVIAESATVTTGSEVNTYTTTFIANETYHQIEEVGLVLDFYYQFDIGQDGIPVQVTAKGRVDEGSVPSGGDTVLMQVYDFVADGWDTIGSGDGVYNSAPADDILLTVLLFARHVGTAGATENKVRIRFYGAAMEDGTTVYIDQVFVLYANVINYAGINAEVDTALSDYAPMLATEDGSSFTSLPAVTLANGAHGGAAASITLSDYSDFTGAAAANPNVLQSGTITVTSQTEFTLSAGSADDDAYNNMILVLEDASTATQKSVRTVLDYVGATKAITIDSAPDFTIVNTDKFDILAIAPGSTPPTVGQIRAEIDSNSTQLAAIVEDTGTTIPGTITALQSDVTDILTDTGTTLDGKIDDILTDTGTTIPGTITTLQSDVTDILTDTGTTLDGKIDDILTDTGTTLDGKLDDILTDTGTTIPGTITALQSDITDILADTGTTLDDKIDSIKTITDALTAAAASKLALSAGTMVAGTVSHDNTAASTTVFYADDIVEATDDHFNGRIVIFTSGDLQYQATDITDYELDTGEGKFTVTALTEAPADNVTFIIV